MKIEKIKNKHGSIIYHNENGLKHREDGPAHITKKGSKFWYINGKQHREDGPAVEYNIGNVEYWINDIKYSKEDWEDEIVKRKLEKIKDL